MNRPFIPARLASVATLVAVLAGCTTSDERAGADSAAPAAPPVAVGSDSAAAPGADGAAAVAAGALLDPDAATREQLLALPGMDAAAADALIAGRPYENMVAVDRALASHLTDVERKALFGHLWKPLDLNTASKEEILLIPGVGARMQHEFEEYRPYRNIAQFRREIGKYVDDQEVARLERYVSVR